MLNLKTRHKGKTVTAIQFKLLNDKAQMPRRQSAGAAGFDLHCTDDVFITPFSRALVATGVQAVIARGYGGFIRDRSSIALKHGVTVSAGVIDWDYEGELKVILNTSSSAFAASKGDRIAQLVVHAVLTDSYAGDIFGESIRGAQGFGSTGI